MTSSHAGARQAGHFDEIGDLYLWVRRELPITRAYYDFWTRELLCRAPEPEAGWSMDGMCGGADVAWEATGGRWIGIDIALNLLANTPKGQPRGRVERVCGDVLNTPITSGSLDAVYIRGGLHHVPDYAAALREFFRILRPGGRLIMTEPSDDFVVHRVLRRALYRVSDCFDEETEHAFRRSELAPAIERAGFAVREYRPFGYVAYFLLANTDVLTVFQRLQSLPGSLRLARVLIRLDEWLVRLPIVRRSAFAAMIVAEKPSRG